MNPSSNNSFKPSVRVLHVIGSMDRGGAETWLMNVLRNLRREEVAFDFLVHKPEAAAYDQEMLALGAERHVDIWPNNPLTYSRGLMKILRNSGSYDVVHSHVHHFSGFVLLIAKLAGVPVRVAHSHSDTTLNDKGASVSRRVYLKLTHMLIQRTATSGIAVSRQAAISLFGKNWERDDRWKIVYCGINRKQFVDPIESTGICRELDIPDGSFVVGHVGRMDNAKNQSFLIDVFKYIKEKKSNAILLLIGDGDSRNDIVKKVDSLNLTHSVIFAGIRDDVPQIMRKCMDIFVFPSKYEGLPLSLVEAQMAGLPCIASDSITKEVQLSNNCQFLSLNNSAKNWAEFVLSRKFFNMDQLDGNRFDITLTNDQLLAIYKADLTNQNR